MVEYERRLLFDNHKLTFAAPILAYDISSILAAPAVTAQGISRARETSMALKYEVGQKFPSVSLLDDRERAVSIAELAEGRPLILAFFRGPW